MRHIRALGLCSAGARAWAVLHGFDMLDFIRHGTPAERLEATGDLYALRVCALARAEADRG